MISIGLSSGSMTTASATQLAQTVSAAGGMGVDLRIGKTHQWEAAGVAAGIETIVNAGLDVFFTGTGWRLGTPIDLPADENVPTDFPVKVFCVEGPDMGLIAEQVAAASAAGLHLWVETHRGGPNVAALTALCAQIDLGVVLDLQGLLETGGADASMMADLAPHVRAIQVKGVARADTGYRHRPLRRADLDIVSAVLAAGAPVCAVTVESRAGTPVQDLKVLKRTLAMTTGEEEA
ncbi:hypothetical protein FE391_09165 [Nonomuraea sp. KC401]|uniref:hypothetical protein n=1 Tax=unclassified Nonomuraea TaxID=2593643 RepID=UPI0010FE5BA5|nr:MULTISPECIES: hypothetical protein [unclassified Nonomuraea]NBE92565.1 hypothetical protein [Nonomuraea sp. K271]TLF79762.1 hypothetical protein FE391_09165 [Nonomuraea sp. KC401]